MPNKGKNIKTYSHYLYIFIFINIILYLYYIIKMNFNFVFTSETYNDIFVKNGIIFTISTLITFILNGLITSNLKAILVFWKVTDIYPGCRVFTKLIDKDSRIDRDILIKVFGKLPTNPESQNKLWYRIYKKYEFDPMIFHSHRNFLLSRDLTSLSFLFLIIYSIAAVIAMFIYNNDFESLLLYIGLLLLQYSIISIVSRNYGNRFVCNVLAKACSDS